MTTEIAQSMTEQKAREGLPPVERAAEHAPSESTAPPGVPTYHDKQPRDANDQQPGAFAKSVASWIHKHPEAHNRTLFGRTVYQYLRSFAASVPYGLSMAGVLAGLTGMQRGGEHLAQNAKSGFMRGVGRNLNGFASFGPARMSLLIGASFTLYRGTSKLGKWMTEYLFNPHDSEQHTAEKVSDLPQEAWRKIKEIAPAESASTPVSAIVLGFIVSAFNKPVDLAAKGLDWSRAAFKNTVGLGNKLKFMGRVLTPQTKFVQHSAINTFGYSLFFELGDRLFKDTQIRRGVWPGEDHSIKALKAAPDEYEKGIQQQNIDENKPKFEDSAAEARPEKSHYKAFTAEPSVPRFLIRRVLPTAVGITAYTGAKMRWGTMLGNDFSYKAGESLIKKIPKLAWGEGLATSLFFLIPIVTEPWEKAYDNFFAKKERIAQAKDRENRIIAKEMTPRQQANYEVLLDRVNAKERESAAALRA